MRREDILGKIATTGNDFVVDIGGGHRPFPRSNLVIEKYPFDHSLHRDRPMQFPTIPVIKADALTLPIPDGGCDLIFASHIIEHLPDPAGFLQEIKRCSKRVYLEFPTRKRELMFAWSYHQWMIETEGPVLKFYRNDLPQMFGDFFHVEYDAALGAWSEARHEHLNTSLYGLAEELVCEFPEMSASERVLSDSPRGNSRFNFATDITRPKYTLWECAAIAAQSILPPTVYAAAARRKEPVTFPADIPSSVLARLMCLHCRGISLKRSGEQIECSCGARYTRDRGVFDFDVPNHNTLTA